MAGPVELKAKSEGSGGGTKDPLIEMQTHVLGRVDTLTGESGASETKVKLIL